MFQELGLRFDEKFVDNIFFGGKGFGFVFSTEPPERGFPSTEYKSPLLLRLASKVMKFTLKKMLGLESLSWQNNGGDLCHEITVFQKEADAGVEKIIKYKRGKERKKLVVKVPSGVTEGTRIRLKGMGLKGRTPGDLYITINIKN